MRIKFWGAARTVTGSMHMIELQSGTKILLDCGMYQGGDDLGEEFNREFPCDPAEVDYLILSHAHIDHCGIIPVLVKQGFSGKIFATHATYDLVSLMLRDSAQIQEKDVEDENKWRKKRGLDPLKPLYTTKDVGPAMDLFITLSYGSWVKIDRNVEMLFLDAGHILGSASVSLKLKEGEKVHHLGFTGDIGRPNRQILRDPVPMPPCEILISESTYGGKDHESVTDSSESLLAIIEETCVMRRGKLIIPAFSVGRTQELVLTLDKLYNEKRLPKIDVYVDSPLAVNATQVFEMHPECFDDDLLHYMQHDPNPFGFNTLHYVRKVEHSKALNRMDGPAIIISASGMASAGRIKHHIANNVGNARNTILMVGYCAPGTLGARLIDGAEVVRIFGEEFRVEAKIEKLNSMSGHAGQTEMYEFIRATQDPGKMRQLFLVHGEESRQVAFKSFMEERGYKNVVIPMRGESFLFE